MRGRVVQLISRTEAVKAAAVLHTVIAAELLQFTVGRANTGKTFFLVGGQHQFESRLARALHLLGIGADLHPLRYRIDTGRYESSRAGGFHHTDAAGADLVDILHEAERGDLHAGLTGRFQNRRTLGYADRNTIDRYIDHFHFSALLSYFFTMASKRHFSIQAPHLIHLSVSMWNGFLISPVIAPTGQTREQAEQPLHFSGTIS